jgi:hypothetical protein
MCTTMRTGKVMAVVAAALLLGAACGEDDGGSVREVGSDSQSGSASGSGSGSGSASAPASGVATAPADCKVEDGASGEATSQVTGELTEFAITLDQTSVAAGLVSFEFENVGAEPHEVAIFRDGDPTTYPTTGDGAADDAALADDLIGEIEPFATGVTCAGTFDLPAGEYVLLCNIVEEEESGEHESHFAEGMYTRLTVTA